MRKNTKLSVRNQTCFKKTSLSYASRKTMNLSMREQTMFKKAYELSCLCDIEVCVIYYGNGGELKTWPEDQSKVRDMAERYIKLNDKQRLKKSTNLFQFLGEKMIHDKKFSEKVIEMKNSLKCHLQILQSRVLQLSHSENHTEPDQTHMVPCGFDQDLSHTSDFPTELSQPILIKDHHQQQWTEQSFMNGFSSTDQDLSTSSFSQEQSKYAVFLYNHDNGCFYQLPNSVPSFDQRTLPCNNMSTAQRFGLTRSNNIDLSPQMQTQNPLVNLDQFATSSQTSSIWNSRHDNGSFYQLPNSVSSFDQTNLPCHNMSTAQRFGLTRSNNIDLSPQMQTQNPLDQFAAWNQTTSLTDPFMFSYN